MKAKWLVTAPLLAFVAASVAALIVQEVRPRAPGPEPGTEGPGHKVVVTYFHGLKRCPTCRKIEALAHEAVQKGFPQQLKQGLVEWRVANFEAPGNEHFVKDYGIVASTVVAADFRDGKRVGYKNLEEVWDRLEDQDAFTAFVQDNVRAFLTGEEAAAPAEPVATGLLLGLATALWLGVLTSISPCPLATNIAAISFIGRRVGSSRQVLLSGLLYTVGRTLAYVVLAVLIVGGLLYKAEVSALLSRYLNRALGPVLILVGMVLLALVQFTVRGFAPGEKTQRRAEAMGVWGAGLLGVVFALAFCPVSAALFFGSLVAVSLKCGSSVLLPSAYGIGTALPVVAFAFVIALSAQSLGKVFHRLTQFEWWARRITGGIFVLVGVYFCLTYIFRAL